MAEKDDIEIESEELGGPSDTDAAAEKIRGSLRKTRKRSHFFFFFLVFH